MKCKQNNQVVAVMPEIMFWRPPCRVLFLLTHARVFVCCLAVYDIVLSASCQRCFCWSLFRVFVNGMSEIMPH